jgi:DNA-binding CsgD family transcriptional regulator
MTTENLLREREKELACIHAICLLAAGAPEPAQVAEGLAITLRKAMRHDEDACCEVRFVRNSGPDGIGDVVVEAESSRDHCAEDSLNDGFPSIEASLLEDASLGWRGGVRLEYRDQELSFLPQEQALLDSVLIVAASMLRTANLIAQLRASTERLEAKNIALREVLSSIEEEKHQMARSMKERLAMDILPLAERAKDASLRPERRDAYMDLLVDELHRSAASLGRDPGTPLTLSPREREVAVQVRNGRTSKEIAELLGIALATVERHRHNIRRKLHVSDRGADLGSLLSIDR